MNRERRLEKIQMKKTLRIHDQKNTKQKDNDKTPEGTVPTYLVEREGHNRAKALSNMVKQKRKEKAGKWSVPLPKVRAQSEADVFKVIQTGKRKKKAHVTHPELKTTFYLDIIGVKKNPSSAMYTSLGVLSKGTIIEVNVSELGLVTQGGKIIWGKYAQVTNNPENDCCVNAVLLV